MAFLALVLPVATFVGQPLALQSRVAARMSSTALPDMYRERWADDRSHLVERRREKQQYDAATYVGALLGASAIAALGVGASTMSTDFSISLLSAAGVFNEQVLFTDILMRWLDAANVAGYAILPLAVLYLMQAGPGRYLATANADVENLEDEACLITEIEEQWEAVCGAVSFDSTEDMMCVEDYSSGSLKWVCA